VREAVRALRAGGAIAYPTETVFGLGCAPLDLNAIERILALKRRPVEKGLILIGATLNQLLPFIDVNDLALLDRLTQTTERPTTWICPLRANVPRWLHGRHHTIAVRITTHPIAQQLCQQFGSAIVSTSANPAGLKPAHNTLEVKRYFGNQLDYILNGHCAPHAQPSQLIELMSGRVIRG